MQAVHPAAPPMRSRSADDVFKILKQNFDEAYSGNRAPLPLFIHTPW